MSTRSRRVAAFGVLAALALGVTAAAQIGTRLSPLQRVPSFDFGGGASRSVLGRLVPPLTRSFVERVLGLGASPPGERPAQRAMSATTGAQRRPSLGRTLFEHPLTNDTFQRALPITSLPFTARTDDQKAGRQRGEPAACGANGRTIWYRYRPDSDVGLIADTFGTTGATAIGIFEGHALDGLRAVGCDTNADGDSYLPFAAVGGTTYFIQVTHSIAGRVVFSLDRLGATTMESRPSSGGSADDASGWPALSADGRYVAFHSWASNLVERDNEVCSKAGARVYAKCIDVFVRDRSTGATKLVSVSSEGIPGDDASGVPAISADGRYVSFSSWATNLIPDDTNDWPDIFVRDLVTGDTKRVSVSSTEDQGRPSSLPFNSQSTSVSAIDWIGQRAVYAVSNGSTISADGRFIAFASGMDGLVPGDNDGLMDIFVRDRLLGTTERVSLSTAGEPANGHSQTPAISNDGRYVAFTSEASNLVEADSNSCQPDYVSCQDVFVRDRARHTTVRVSVSSTGAQGDSHSTFPSISDDGRHVAFMSTATNFAELEDCEQPLPAREEVFLHDRVRGTTTLVSVSSGGQRQCSELETTYVPGKGPPFSIPAISGDGRYVAFFSFAPEIGPDEDERVMHVYVHDRVTRATVTTSVSSAGEFGDDHSYNVEMSRTGEFVAFASSASNLVEDDDNQCLDTTPARSCADVFVHHFPLIG